MEKISFIHFIMKSAIIPHSSSNPETNCKIEYEIVLINYGFNFG